MTGIPCIQAWAGSATALSFAPIISAVLRIGETLVAGSGEQTTHDKEDGTMRIAIPLAAGKLTMHFGHCERFALIDVDPEAKKILARQELEAPEHQPGLFPRWLARAGCPAHHRGGHGRQRPGPLRPERHQGRDGSPVRQPRSRRAGLVGRDSRHGDKRLRPLR